MVNILSSINALGIHIVLNYQMFQKGVVMFNMFSYYDRNKKLNELLEGYIFYSNDELAEGKNLIIEIEDKHMEIPLKMNELEYLNRENIGYAVVHFQEKGFCLLFDDFEKNSEAKLIPFNNGKINIDVIYKKKKLNVSFFLTSEK